MSGQQLRVGGDVEVRVPGEQCEPRPGLRLGRLRPRRVGHLPRHRDRAARPGRHGRGRGRGTCRCDATHLVHRAMQVAWAELGVDAAGGPAPRLPQRGAARAGDGLVGDGHRHRHRCGARRCTTSAAGGPVTTSTSRSPTASRRASRGTRTTRRRSVHGGADPVVDAMTTAPAPRPCTCPCTPTSSRWCSLPDAQLSTAKARSVLPLQVRLADAAANSARAALLVHALGAAPEHLLAATRDWLHQEARRSSYAGSMDLVDRPAGRRSRRGRLRRRAVGARADPARPGGRGQRTRRRGMAGADARHPTTRCARRGDRDAADRIVTEQARRLLGCGIGRGAR